MTDGVTKRYELTSTYDCLLDIISSNVTDSESRTEVAQWIKNGFPNPAKYGECPADKGWKFPLVILHLPDIEDETIVLDGSKNKTRLSVKIDCCATTRLKANQLAEEIRYVLKITGHSELNVAALFSPDVISSSEDSDFIGATKFYTKSIVYEFMRLD